MAEKSQRRKKTRKKEENKFPSPVNLWGIAGRQEMMELRRLWQLRIPGK